MAKGELTEKLDFEVAGMSQAAQDAVAKLGGKVSILTPPKEEAEDKPKKAKKAAEPKAEASEEEAPTEEAPAEEAEVASDDEASED